MRSKFQPAFSIPRSTRRRAHRTQASQPRATVPACQLKRHCDLKPGSDWFLRPPLHSGESPLLLYPHHVLRALAHAVARAILRAPYLPFKRDPHPFLLCQMNPSFSLSLFLYSLPSSGTIPFSGSLFLIFVIPISLSLSRSLSLTHSPSSSRSHSNGGRFLSLRSSLSFPRALCHVPTA